MRSNLIKMLAGVAAIAAFVVAAPVASAQTAGVCAYVGHADVNADPVIWVGGGGNFGFTSSIAACAGEQNGAPAAGLAGISASGTYTSLVCGTSNPLSGSGSATLPLPVVGNVTVPTAGAATGTATLTGPIPGTGQFSIPFVGGQGVTLGNFTASNGDHGPLAGFVTIFPDGHSALNAVLPGGDFVTGGPWNDGQPPVPPSNVCVDHYGVAGTFAIVS